MQTKTTKKAPLQDNAKGKTTSQKSQSNFTEKQIPIKDFAYEILLKKYRTLLDKHVKLQEERKGYFENRFEKPIEQSRVVSLF